MKFIAIKIGFIILVAAVIIVWSQIGYIQYQIIVNTDQRVIEQFSSSDVKFAEIYKVENRRIVNIARENVIFPDDRLEYRLTITNPLEHDSRITYELEATRAGDPVALESGEWTIPSNKQMHKWIEFFLNEEGLHDLKLKLTFYNQTDEKKYEQYESLERDVQVLSIGNKLQDDANQLNFYSLFVAGIIGFGTVIALGFSVYFSRKQMKVSESQVKIFQTQNENLEKQLKITKADSLHRAKPNIEIKHLGMMSKDGKQIARFTIKNGSNFTARNVTCELIKGDEHNSVVSIVEKSVNADWADYIYPGNLLPKYSISYETEIDADWEKIQTRQICFMTNFDVLSESFHELFIFYFNKEGYSGNEHWSNEDVSEMINDAKAELERKSDKK